METLASGNAPANADNTANADTTNADANAVEANGDGSAPSVPEADTPAPKKDSVQERIDKLTRDKYDALRERDRNGYELETLRERLKALETAKPPEVAPQNDFPTLEQHGYDEAKYQSAVTAHIAKVTKEQGTAAAQEVIRQEREAEAQRKANESWATKEAEFIKSKPDYLEKVRNNPALKISPHMAQVIMESPVGAQVAYHLGENLEKSALIAQMPPLSQARELGRIEAQIEAEKAKPKPAVSQAPPPVQKVDSSNAEVDPDPSAMTDTQFAKWRKKQIAARRNQ